MSALVKYNANILDQIDKSNWKNFAFENIAFNISERVEPGDTDVEVYVGLEHLDPDSIHIRREGAPSDVKGTKLRVYKGDIIFGKRRAYQRKAAIAHFDGICSAHAMVLRANPETIVPELFPFFVHSDEFMLRAVKISEGSLSPTIKWNALKGQKFRLPPLSLQKELAELLWEIDGVIEDLLIQKDAIISAQSHLVESLIWNENFPKKELSSISTLRKGLQDGDWIESKDMSKKGIRLIQLADIGEGAFLNKSSRYISEKTFNDLHCFEVLPGDLLLARMPDPIGRTCIVPDSKLRMITAVDCCVIRVNETENDKSFFLHLLNSTKMRKKIISLATGTTRQRVSTSNLRNILIPKPVKSLQRKISGKLDIVSATTDLINGHYERSRTLSKTFLNAIL